MENRDAPKPTLPSRNPSSDDASESESRDVCDDGGDDKEDREDAGLVILAEDTSSETEEVGPFRDEKGNEGKRVILLEPLLPSKAVVAPGAAGEVVGEGGLSRTGTGLRAFLTSLTTYASTVSS